MSTQEPSEPGTDPEVAAVSDRRMVLIIGQVLVEEGEKARTEGGQMLAWQLGSRDALAKHPGHALAGCVTMLRGQHSSPKDLVAFAAACSRGCDRPSGRR